MPSTLLESPAATVLEALYADAETRMTRHFEQAPPRPKPSEDPRTPLQRYTDMKDLYMPIDAEFGKLLYSLVRATQARTVVEFGTSFGISAIFLASALKDNGAGRLITTEFIEEKLDVARKNLADAGLSDWLDYRLGDALTTLEQDLGGAVDFVFLDGDKSMYFDVLRVLEPKMKPGCIVASDNTDHEGLGDFLAYLRDPANGYVSSDVLTAGGPNHTRGHEISVRV